jgi:hypothetical protein
MALKDDIRHGFNAALTSALGDSAVSPPLHQNCQCEIHDGIWCLGGNPCDECRATADQWNEGTEGVLVDQTPDEEFGTIDMAANPKIRLAIEKAMEAMFQ